MSATAEVDYDSLSVMEQMALLDPDERDALIEDLSIDDLYDAELWLRPDQLRAYHDETPTVLVSAGRGSGKTRTGASWVNEKARANPGSIGHLVGRTVSDVRDVMIQGESGILAISPPSFKPEYHPSLRKLLWPNGSYAMTFTSEVPSQLRGPQSHWTWVDEMAALNHRPDDSGLTTWDQVRIGTRLGAHPQIFITTTPKRVKAVRELFALVKSNPGKVSLHGASTLANRAHLSAEYLQNLVDLYAGTALERQELFGELVDIVEGALWRNSDIVMHDADFLVGPTLSVIGVDPGLTTGGDATGIVVVRGSQERAITMRKALVVEDYTEPGLGPEQWAARVVTAWQIEKEATGTIPIIVAEKNAGGEMVASTLEGQAGENELPIALVPSIRSKAARAEPIVLAYRRHRVRHLIQLELLEDEMTTWEPPTPGISKGSGWSPNRIDALTVAATALLVNESPLRRFGVLSMQEPSEVVTIPTARWRRDRPTGLSLPWREGRD